MRFVDLFAGLGGFHVALSRLGHRCVFACEIDPTLREVYRRNFGLIPYGDIRGPECIAAIPPHDILCAGFPCQPFSKAGVQSGVEDERWGDLFSHVLKVLARHRSPYVILENVPNLERHNGGHTWARMECALHDLGYDVRTAILSPHQFTVPHQRQRLFIAGALGPGALDAFTWPGPAAEPGDLVAILDDGPPDAPRLSTRARRCIEVWGDFIRRFPSDEELPSFPIWAMEFGATYPYQGRTPWAIGESELRHFRGPLGVPLAGRAPGSVLEALPSHARTREARFPRWKETFIRQNRDLYARHKGWIDRWLPEIAGLPPSLQKFEWNCKGEERDIWKYVLQFRASGMRVKRPATAPSLVAMTTTQVPVIGWQERYMTVRECARLQGLGDLEHWPAATRAYAALGNAVNVDLVQLIAGQLLPSPPRTGPSRVSAAMRPARC